MTNEFDQHEFDQHQFDRHYWEQHWKAAGRRSHDRGLLANPYLASETSALTPGAALDAGCGEGVEAIWLAANGWTVTAVDISAAAIERARSRSEGGVRSAGVEWIEADLSEWEPSRRFDLVMTSYAHPASSQLAFYERIADWVAPGGTLLIVGHAHDHTHAHDQPPDEVKVTASAVTRRLAPAAWDIVTATETSRTLRAGTGRVIELHDVVVRARRRVDTAGRPA